MNTLGSIIAVREDSYVGHMQVLQVVMSGGETIRQERLWPEVMFRADDGMESMHMFVWTRDAFQELLLSDPETAYAIIDACSERVSGPKLAVSEVAIESFDEGRVKIQSEITHDFDWFEVVKMHCSHSKWDGGESESKEHIFVRGRQGVSCVLYDPKVDGIVLIEEFRIGAIEDKTAWMIGLPTGGLEEGEDPAIGATRECMEEAGAEAKNITHMLTYKPSPGFTTHKVSLFWAECDTSAIEDRINGLDEEGEDIRVTVMPVAKVFEMLRSGTIYNGCANLALLHFFTYFYQAAKLEK